MTSPPQAEKNESPNINDNANIDESKQNLFGILDIQPNRIQTPPKFTEEATISAMRNLGIQPNDLVPSSGRSFDDSDNSSMKFQIAIEMEKRRFEAIEKIIAERNRILENPTNIEIKLPGISIDETAEVSSKRKKKTAAAKSERKKKVKRTFSDATSPSESKRPIKRRQVKPFTRNKNKNQQSPSQLRKNDESPTSRRPNYRSEINNNKDFQFFQVTHTKTIRKQPAVDPQFVVARVRLNQEKREQQLEKHRQLIRKQARLRLQKSKEEETQMAKMKEDLKSKRDERLKRQERMYMKLLDKKRKAFENDKKKRQEKIYQKAKLETHNNNNEQRFSKLKQKMLEMQNTNKDSDLFSVTRPMNPKAPGPISDLLSSDVEPNKTFEPTQNARKPPKPQVKDAMLITDSTSEINSSFESEVVQKKPMTKYNQLSATNPPILNDVKKVSIRPTKARSSLQENPPQRIIKNNPNRQSPSYYKRLLKLPIVGKNKTRIPCLRK